MKFGTRAALAACSLLALCACDRIPGTNEYAARKSLASTLFDPDSAKLKFLSSSQTAVCGTVNAKNKMGGYVGATPFFYDVKSHDVEFMTDQPTMSDDREEEDLPEADRNKKFEEMDDACHFPERWKKLCGNVAGVVVPEPNRVCQLWLAGNWTQLYKEAHQ